MVLFPMSETNGVNKGKNDFLLALILMKIVRNAVVIDPQLDSLSTCFEIGGICENSWNTQILAHSF